MIRQTAVKNLPRTASVAGGGRDEERRLKENAGAMTRETNVKTPPRTATAWRGARRKGECLHLVTSQGHTETGIAIKIQNEKKNHH